MNILVNPSDKPNQMKERNIVVLHINAYAAYRGRDMAGAIRVRNFFDPVLESPENSVSNLILLNIHDFEHNGEHSSITDKVTCLSIGYSKIYNPVSVIRYLKNGFRFLKKQKKEGGCNILYNYESPDIRNILFIRYAKKIGYKIVVDLVEDKEYEETRTFNDRCRKSLSLYFIRQLKHLADGMITISSHLYKKTQSITEGKVPNILLPISVDLKKIPETGSTPGTHPKLTIIYGGSFAQKDGLNDLLEAVVSLEKNHKDFCLKLAGKGKEEDMAIINGYMEKSKCIEFIGYLPPEEYYKVLAQADICCMTRNNSAFANGGFPFKLGEYLAAGKIVIATKVGDVSKYLTHRKDSILINPDNRQELIGALEYALENYQELKTAMGNAAKKTAKENFCSDMIREKLLAYLNNICSGQTSEIP